MPQVSKQRRTDNGPAPPRASGRPLRGSQGSDARSAWDLVAGIKMLLYGQSGTGKTTFWATAPGPILCLVCSGGSLPGELRSIDTPEYRKKITARIVDSSVDVVSLLADSDDFATVVLDHVSGLADLTLKEILGYEELPAQKSWGLASQQQYGQLAGQMKDNLRALLNFPGNVVIVGQERTFNDDAGSDIVQPYVSVAVTPAVETWLRPACDYQVNTQILPKMIRGEKEVKGKMVKTTVRGKGVDYCLRVGPHDYYKTKLRVPDPSNLPEFIVNPTFAKVQALIDGTWRPDAPVKAPARG